MTKIAGKACRLYAAGYDISGDTMSFDGSFGLADLDITGFGNAAIARIVGLEDHGLTTRNNWDDTATTGLDVAYTTLNSTNDIIVSLLYGTTQAAGTTYTAASWASTFRGQLMTGYGISSAVDGKVEASGTFMSNASADMRQKLLFAKATQTSATNGSGTTGWTSSTGLSAILHVFAFTGTSCTVKIQHAPDGSTWADLLTFTAATGRTSERKATSASASVDDHLRVVTTGTFSSCTFAVLAKIGISAP